MTSNSTLDPENFPERSRTVKKPNDTPSLGPSDSSDSGSDLAGVGPDIDDELVPDENSRARSDESDRYGTGERRSARKDTAAAAASDIDVDRVVGPAEAGLGGGLDQAEEAQLGVTDEQLARRRRDSVISDGKHRR